MFISWEFKWHDLVNMRSFIQNPVFISLKCLSELSVSFEKILALQINLLLFPYNLKHQPDSWRRESGGYSWTGGGREILHIVSHTGRNDQGQRSS